MMAMQATQTAHTVSFETSRATASGRVESVAIAANEARTLHDETASDNNICVVATVLNIETSFAETILVPHRITTSIPLNIAVNRFRFLPSVFLVVAIDTLVSAPNDDDELAATTDSVQATDFVRAVSTTSTRKDVRNKSDR